MVAPYQGFKFNKLDSIFKSDKLVEQQSPQLCVGKTPFKEMRDFWPN